MSQQRDPITCHILDTTVGLPARNVIVQIHRVREVEDMSNTDTPDSTKSTKSAKSTAVDYQVDPPFARAKTNDDGRVVNWVFDPSLQRDQDASFATTGVRDGKWVKLVPGLYKIKFLTGKYFKDLAIGGGGGGGVTASAGRTFFPVVEVVFEVDDLSHYHIPLLLSNYSYSTYRGS
ncbi:hypothetical protein KGF57_003937 [Candida theae]|uniref:Transthyretin/hydroxyisourate hydrolase domain-containing protein n=1 Tax=Candida theae TaxID=1198502 RepID=A0AAD5BCJ0_9ASCO|nr:uncharacterized protein KGF57_003937 [Candida theae]KAI5953728.1 hypothetical protein KGF57_003937 [Candida theae]